MGIYDRNITLGCDRKGPATPQTLKGDNDDDPSGFCGIRLSNKPSSSMNRS